MARTMPSCMRQGNGLPIELRVSPVSSQRPARAPQPVTTRTAAEPGAVAGYRATRTRVLQRNDTLPSLTGSLSLPR